MNAVMINPTPWATTQVPASASEWMSPERATQYAVAGLRIYKDLRNNTSLSLGVPSALDRKIAEVKRLVELPEDWDGEGAACIEPQAISSALSILTSMPKDVLLPETAPNSSGTISLYWKTATGTAELEIGRSRYSWVFFPRGRREEAVTESGHVTSSLTGHSLSELWTQLGVRGRYRLLRWQQLDTVSPRTAAQLTPWKLQIK